MLASEEVGRLTAAEVAEGVPFDAPEKVVRALLNKIDELIDTLKQLKADGYVAASGIDDAIDGLAKLKLRQ